MTFLSLPSAALRAFRYLLLLSAGLGTLDCRADELVALKGSERNRRVSAAVGDHIEITLQTIGPGEYSSPPAISSAAVTFLDVVGCGDPVPAGPTQCFRFRAAARGQ